MKKSQLIKELRFINGLCDPWGSALNLHFAICDELYYRDPNLVPPQWEYSPGMFSGSDPRDFERYEAELCKVETTENLLWAGRILMRYENLLRRYEMNY